MKCSALPIIVLLLAQFAPSQTAPATPPPPQTARQALIEMFFGKTPDHFRKHLAQNTKKAVAKLEAGGGKPNYFADFENLSSQFATGGGQQFETFDAGPVLVSGRNPMAGEQFELHVDRDDLIGDEDQIELSVHAMKAGKPVGMPVLPKIQFSMKTEDDVWRLTEIAFTARAPIADPDYLASLVGQLQEQQRRTNEMMASATVHTLPLAESAYHSTHSTYTCSLKELAAGIKGKNQSIFIDDELAAGKKQGYVYALTGCDASRYKLAAEPATSASGQRAYCTDEGREVKSSISGKASTCFSSGEPANQSTGLGAISIQP
jgi:hypothetical protein